MVFYHMDFKNILYHIGFFFPLSNTSLLFLWSNQYVTCENIPVLITSISTGHTSLFWCHHSWSFLFLPTSFTLSAFNLTQRSHARPSETKVMVLSVRLWWANAWRVWHSLKLQSNQRANPASTSMCSRSCDSSHTLRYFPVLFPSSKQYRNPLGAHSSPRHICMKILCLGDTTTVSSEPKG